jgi:hypothetical protein
LPLIGWLFASYDYGPVIKSVTEQLLARPKPDPNIWGDSLARQQMAQYLCAALKQDYGWPNDHFIPDDPYDIAFQIPWDDLEIAEFVIRVERELKIKMKYEETETWGAVLGEIVDFLIAKQEAARV